MKLIKTLYKDSQGNIWEIERMSLPKKKGVYAYYLAECQTLNLSLKENLKRELIKKIKNLQNGTQP